MLKDLMSTKVINQAIKTSYMMKTIKANTVVLPEISYYRNKLYLKPLIFAV